MFSRRKFLASGTVAVISCSAHGQWPKETQSEKTPQALTTARGCYLKVGQLKNVENETGEPLSLGLPQEMIQSSGDAALDKALGLALVRVATLFDVRPGFAFYNDNTAPNALASEESRLPNTSGTILFGLAMFHNQLARFGDNDKGISILAIAAHEFGHIVQYRRKLQDRLLKAEATVRPLELHADFLSGYFLGRRKKDNPGISLWAAGKTFDMIGDTLFSNPNHHGTPAERVAAAEAGFKVGHESSSGISDAVDLGLAHLGK